ncbi:MAG: DUF721 domain-containing protein [Spirochaetota bacterium]
MRPLRPLFRRSAPKDELERQAERLRNRDWIEMLRVVHPAQASQAEQEYLLARLRDDWAELVNPLLAQHSQPAEFSSTTLLVHCDHNTFANELMLVASVVEKKIQARYGYSLKIRARATQRLAWPKQRPEAEAPGSPRQPEASPAQTAMDSLIAELTEYSNKK